MSRKNECKIVQDLLPNYVEGLTNEETNLFIEEHLKECNTCKKNRKESHVLPFLIYLHPPQ